jgi:hypothetical protein
MPTIREYLNENIDKYENRTDLIDDTVKTLDVTPRAVKKQLRRVLKESNGGILPAQSNNTLSKAMSGESFRKEHDLTIKVKKALNSLGTNVIYDHDFRSEMHIPVDKWKRITVKIDPEQKYRLKVKGKWIWGMPNVLQRIEETIDII